MAIVKCRVGNPPPKIGNTGRESAASATALPAFLTLQPHMVSRPFIIVGAGGGGPLTAQAEDGRSHLS